MVSLAQLVRASDCGSEGRGFDPHISPNKESFFNRGNSLFMITTSWYTPGCSKYR